MPPAQLARAIDTLLNARTRTVEDVLNEFFTEDYRQRISGRWVDRDGVRAAIEQVRSLTDDPIIVTALDEIEAEDGIRFAERHTLSYSIDGVEHLRATNAFGSRAPDGRFVMIEETTLVLQPEPVTSNR